MFRMYGWKGSHLENFLNINNFETENATLKHTFLVSFDLIKAKPSSLIDLLFLLQRLILQYLHIFDLQSLLLFFQCFFKLLLNNLCCWFFTMLFFYSTIKRGYRGSSHFVIFGSRGLSWNARIMNSEDCFKCKTLKWVQKNFKVPFFC